MTGVCLPAGGTVGRFSFEIDFGTFALTTVFGFFDRSTVNDADEQESVRSLNRRREKHVHTCAMMSAVGEHFACEKENVSSG